MMKFKKALCMLIITCIVVSFKINTVNAAMSNNMRGALIYCADYYLKSDPNNTQNYDPTQSSNIYTHYYQSNTNTFVLLPFANFDQWVYNGYTMVKGSLNKDQQNTVTIAQALIDYYVNKHGTNIKIYIGTPAFNGYSTYDQSAFGNYNAATANDYVNQIISAINDPHVVGVYLNLESIEGTGTNETFGYNTLSSMVSNAKSIGKKVLWIPFYNATISRVSNQLQQMDTLVKSLNEVTIQPNYYFSGNINGIYWANTCASDNKIYGSTSSSGTVPSTYVPNSYIGPEMELDGRVLTDSTFSSRYATYVSTFSKYVTNNLSNDIIFYADNGAKINLIDNYISKFYTSGK